MKLVLVCCLLLGGCTTTGQATLAGLSEHLQKRDCQTEGRIDIVPTGFLSSVTGSVQFKCPKPE